MAELADVVALFHSTFHPTKGNIIDWSAVSIPDLVLDGVEFSSLPSGLHLVAEDVIHFTCQGYSGVCIFRRRDTSDHGERGARLGALGLLVAKSSRTRPWRHLSSLKRLSDQLEDDPARRDILQEYFDAHNTSSVQAPEENWNGWTEELSQYSQHPILRLPKILRLLGPTSVTYIKHVLAHKRVLIYTHPSAELACELAIVGREICFGQQQKYPESVPTVLGMVGLTDMTRLQDESSKGYGWIACTTDKLFLEKANIYDLLIDLTTPNEARAVRPTLAVSRTSHGTRHSVRLHTVRFTFSDLRLWSQLDRILLDHPLPDLPNAQPDLYESLSIMCAGWVGALRSRGDGIKIDGDDDVLTRQGTSLSDLDIGSLRSNYTLSESVGRESTPPSLQPTLALLSILHRHIDSLNTRLAKLTSSKTDNPAIFYPRDIAYLELNPLSELDIEFFGGFAEARFRGDERRRGTRVVLRRSWKDLLSLVLVW